MSLGSVTRLCRPPALADDPLPLNIWAQPQPLKGRGGAKLAWLKILKNSARNCTLKLSEIFFTAKFLINEKSMFSSGGPTMLLRPALPRRFAHVPGNCGFANVPLPTKGTHRDAISGVAWGNWKQL